MAKDFRRIAAARIASLGPPPETNLRATAAAMRAIDEAAIAAQARHSQSADSLRRELVAICSSRPGALFRMPFFRFACATPPLSAADACVIAEAALRRQRQAMRDRHWSFDPGALAAAWDAALLARYFRRFGSRIWAKEAA